MIPADSGPPAASAKQAAHDGSVQAQGQYTGKENKTQVCMLSSKGLLDFMVEPISGGVLEAFTRIFILQVSKAIPEDIEPAIAWPKAHQPWISVHFQAQSAGDKQDVLVKTAELMQSLSMGTSSAGCMKDFPELASLPCQVKPAEADQQAPNATHTCNLSNPDKP